MGPQIARLLFPLPPAGSRLLRVSLAHVCQSTGLGGATSRPNPRGGRPWVPQVWVAGAGLWMPGALPHPNPSTLPRVGPFAPGVAVWMSVPRAMPATLGLRMMWYLSGGGAFYSGTPFQVVGKTTALNETRRRGAILRPARTVSWRLNGISDGETAALKWLWHRKQCKREEKRGRGKSLMRRLDWVSTETGWRCFGHA